MPWWAWLVASIAMFFVYLFIGGTTIAVLSYTGVGIKCGYSYSDSQPSRGEAFIFCGCSGCSGDEDIARFLIVVAWPVVAALYAIAGLVLGLIRLVRLCAGSSATKVGGGIGRMLTKGKT